MAFELFMSPTRKPTETETLTPTAFTFVADRVTHLLSPRFDNETMISLPERKTSLVTVAPPESSTVTEPKDVTGALKRNAILCPVPTKRGSTVIAPLM